MNNHFKSIHLKNFGSWIDQEFELHPGVNVIIGESGTGKSGFIKAFDFVMNNETPKSADGALGFINRPLDRGKIAEVVLEAYSGDHIDTITRTRGKSVNTYQLNQDTPQKAFGKGNVPDHIAKIINMSEVNYHKQKQLPFLLDENPGEVAKQLTGIINLEEIDESVALANSSVRENKKTLNQLIEDQEIIENQIKDLEYVQEFKAEIDLFIQEQEVYYKNVNKFDKIDLIVCDIQDLEAQINQYSDLMELSSAIQAVEAENVKFDADSAKFDKIVDIVVDLEDLNHKQLRCSKLIELGKQVELIETQQHELILEKNKQSKIRTILNQISDLERSSKQSLELIKLSKQIQEFDEQEKQFKQQSAKYYAIDKCISDIVKLNMDNNVLIRKISDGNLKLLTMACPTCGRRN